MNSIQALLNYLRSSKAELKKVTWPSKQNTLRYSALVIAVSLILAGFFTLLDFGFSRVVDAGLSAQQSNMAQTEAQPEQPVNVEPVDVQTEGETPIMDFSDQDTTLTPTPEAPAAESETPTAE
ncbi:preprotein translocase subunit SecE [Patescibacteria group bacterium]|nr:preprotein translocase subunit SecE [Patescibacteria group bacterium]MBU1034943.1 preprotein translocase subunit SecE [Patescibacteria group bacterium]MBU1630152.1 preprotein translocase subunit SecE [Patescibacteria group bacterium]MBU1907743.1 preprotein translocase subunit SecE [Patescibacteria group bacterium]